MADPKTKAELEQVLSKLRDEVGQLAETHADEAKSISAFAALSEHEATRAKPRPELRALAIEGLQRSVHQLEDTHPRLVEIVGMLSSLLSNVGM
jgi:hypothetical protein